MRQTLSFLVVVLTGISILYAKSIEQASDCAALFQGKKENIQTTLDVLSHDHDLMGDAERANFIYYLASQMSEDPIPLGFINKETGKFEVTVLTRNMANELLDTGTVSIKTEANTKAWTYGLNDFMASSLTPHQRRNSEDMFELETRFREFVRFMKEPPILISFEPVRETPVLDHMAKLFFLDPQNGKHLHLKGCIFSLDLVRLRQLSLEMETDHWNHVVVSLQELIKFFQNATTIDYRNYIVQMQVSKFVDDKLKPLDPRLDRCQIWN